MIEDDIPYGPFKGMKPSRLHSAMVAISRRVDMGVAMDAIERDLVAEGLSTSQASAAVELYRWKTTLITEGPFAGLTEMQRSDAIYIAGWQASQGARPEDAVKEIRREGFSSEQAIAAIEAHKAALRAEQNRGAPVMILTGVGMAVVGVLATAGSRAMATGSYRVYGGLIAGGLAMALVGLYRRLRD